MGIQLILPIFPDGAININNLLSFQSKDSMVYYFLGCLPLFSHSTDDLDSFRFITAQLYLNGHVSQREIVQTFGVSAISVKRSVKALKEKGISGFKKQPRKVKNSKMTDEVLQQIQTCLDQGESISEVAKKLNLKANTIQKLVRKGTLKKKTLNPLDQLKVIEVQMIKSQHLVLPAPEKLSA